MEPLPKKLKRLKQGASQLHSKAASAAQPPAAALQAKAAPIRLPSCSWVHEIRDAPVYHPTLEQFANPIAYIRSIQQEAVKYGLCRIVPPCLPSRSPAKVLSSSVGTGGQLKFTARYQQLGQTPQTSFEGVRFMQSHKSYSLPEFEKIANDYHRKHFGTTAMMPSKLVEVEYWRKQAAALRDEPMNWVQYGNDVEGSAFSDDPDDALGSSKWNLKVLPLLPGSLLRHVTSDIPGVTSPMLYIGQLFSTFAWHVEDHSLYSINYSHAGEHKVWYGVPASDADGFEDVVLSEIYGPAAAAARSEGLSETEIKDKCLAALIDKTTTLNPGVLLKHGVKVYRAVQQPGEFIMTFPRSYHGGFSTGFNFGEAVNFATSDWWPFGADSGARYRRLGREPMLLHEQLLLVEIERLMQGLQSARDAQARLEAILSLDPYTGKPTSADATTLYAFLRLMRWQHLGRSHLIKQLQAASVNFSSRQRLPSGSSSSSATCEVCGDTPAVVLLLLPAGAAGFRDSGSSSSSDSDEKQAAVVGRCGGSSSSSLKPNIAAAGGSVCLKCGLTAAAAAAGSSEGLPSWANCVIMVSRELKKLEGFARQLEPLIAANPPKCESVLGPDGLTEAANYGPEALHDHPAIQDLSQPYDWQPDDAVVLKVASHLKQGTTAAAAAAGKGNGDRCEWQQQQGGSVAGPAASPQQQQQQQQQQYNGWNAQLGSEAPPSAAAAAVGGEVRAGSTVDQQQICGDGSPAVTQQQQRQQQQHQQLSTEVADLDPQAAEDATAAAAAAAATSRDSSTSEARMIDPMHLEHSAAEAASAAAAAAAARGPCGLRSAAAVAADQAVAEHSEAAAAAAAAAAAPSPAAAAAAAVAGLLEAMTSAAAADDPAAADSQVGVPAGAADHTAVVTQQQQQQQQQQEKDQDKWQQNPVVPRQDFVVMEQQQPQQQQQLADMAYLPEAQQQQQQQQREAAQQQQEAAGFPGTGPSGFVQLDEQQQQAIAILVHSEANQNLQQQRQRQQQAEKAYDAGCQQQQQRGDSVITDTHVNLAQAVKQQQQQQQNKDREQQQQQQPHQQQLEPNEQQQQPCQVVTAPIQMPPPMILGIRHQVLGRSAPQRRQQQHRPQQQQTPQQQQQQQQNGGASQAGKRRRLQRTDSIQKQQQQQQQQQQGEQKVTNKGRQLAADTQQQQQSGCDDEVAPRKRQRLASSVALSKPQQQQQQQKEQHAVSQGCQKRAAVRCGQKQQQQQQRTGGPQDVSQQQRQQQLSKQPSMVHKSSMQLHNGNNGLARSVAAFQAALAAICGSDLQSTDQPQEPAVAAKPSAAAAAAAGTSLAEGVKQQTATRQLDTAVASPTAAAAAAEGVRVAAAAVHEALRSPSLAGTSARPCSNLINPVQAVAAGPSAANSPSPIDRPANAAAAAVGDCRATPRAHSGAISVGTTKSQQELVMAALRDLQPIITAAGAPTTKHAHVAVAGSSAAAAAALRGAADPGCHIWKSVVSHGGIERQQQQPGWQQQQHQRQQQNGQQGYDQVHAQHVQAMLEFELQQQEQQQQQQQLSQHPQPQVYTDADVLPLRSVVAPQQQQQQQVLSRQDSLFLRNFLQQFTTNSSTASHQIQQHQQQQQQQEEEMQAHSKRPAVELQMNQESSQSPMQSLQQHQQQQLHWWQQQLQGLQEQRYRCRNDAVQTNSQHLPHMQSRVPQSPSGVGQLASNTCNHHRGDVRAVQTELRHLQRMQGRGSGVLQLARNACNHPRGDTSAVHNELHHLQRTQGRGSGGLQLASNACNHPRGNVPAVPAVPAVHSTTGRGDVPAVLLQDAQPWQDLDLSSKQQLAGLAGQQPLLTANVQQQQQQLQTGETAAPAVSLLQQYLRASVIRKSA